MVKPIYIVLGAIPVIAALLLSTPLILKNEIPTSAANYTDNVEIEYTKHQLKKISYGVTERVGAQKTEILYIKNNGDVKPCCFGARLNVGNIHANDSDEIWSGIGYKAIQDGILKNQYPMSLCGECLEKNNYPKNHFLVNKVNLYKEWLQECHDVVFPAKLYKRVRALSASIIASS